MKIRGFLTLWSYYSRQGTSSLKFAGGQKLSLVSIQPLFVGTMFFKDFRYH